MASRFIESLINSQQLDDENAESDSERDIDIDTEPLHIGIDDILDAEDFENSSKSGHEARPRSTSRQATKLGGWSTVFKPIEVENFTEHTGLKVDLTESSLPEAFDLFFFFFHPKNNHPHN